MSSPLAVLIFIIALRLCFTFCNLVCLSFFDFQLVAQKPNGKEITCIVCMCFTSQVKVNAIVKKLFPVATIKTVIN